MGVQISYNKNFLPKNSLIKVFFIDEKYKVSSIKKHLSDKEFNCISDLLKSKDIKKKILSFEISSKVKIVLVSIKTDATSSDLENLGANFYDKFKSTQIKNFNINSDTVQKNKNKAVGYFLHGLKLKSYKFEKYKSKKSKEKLIFTVTGKNVPSTKDKVKFQSI